MTAAVLRSGEVLRGESGRCYRVRGWHAEGSYSRLYRAEDDLARPCAVKVARPEAPEAASRLDREASIRRDFRHPGVPELRDNGQVAGIPFLALEWIEGGTARALLAGRRGLPLVRAVAISRAVAEVLARMHAVELAHGDLRPDNVLIPGGVDRRAAVVADLGSALRRAESGWDAALLDDRRRLAALFFHLLAGVPPEDSPHALSAARGHHPAAVRLWESSQGGRLPAGEFLRALDGLQGTLHQPPGRVR